MDTTALAVLTARLTGMGYRGDNEQLIKLITLAEQETKERLFMRYWAKFPMLRSFFEHAHKHDMYFIEADPSGQAVARYVRASKDDNVVRLTQFEVRDFGRPDACIVKAIFTRKGEMMKVRNLTCIYKKHQ